MRWNIELHSPFMSPHCVSFDCIAFSNMRISASSHSHVICVYIVKQKWIKGKEGKWFESLMSAVLCNHNVKMDGLGFQLNRVRGAWVVITLLSFRFYIHSWKLQARMCVHCAMDKQQSGETNERPRRFAHRQLAILNLLERNALCCAFFAWKSSWIEIRVTREEESLAGCR